MCRLELWRSPDPFLCSTLLLFLPFVELRPETDSARKIETRVGHQNKADVIRFSFSDSGQCERYERGYRDRDQKKNGFWVDIAQHSKSRKWFCEKLIGKSDAVFFIIMKGDNMSDFVA